MLNALFGNATNSGDALEQVINFIRAYYQACGVVDFNIEPDKEILRYTLIGAKNSIRQLDHPSPFKKAAIFTHYFILQCPITTNLPKYLYPTEVNQRSYHNSVLAFEISRACLRGANVRGKPLSAPIEISRHQHQDLMVAFCQVNELKEAYTRLIAIIYETLVYEFNDGIRFPPDAPLPK